MNNPLGSESPLSWPGLAGIILLQAMSGTRSTFSAYSASLAKHFCISQAQLNYLMVALDTGKVMSWFSSTAAERLPLWMILFIGLIFGSVGYGVQYLCAINKIHSVTYWQLFLLNVLAGNSSCWINTYCELITTRRRDGHNSIAAITSSYSGLSGKIYSSLVEGVQGRKGSKNPSTYLLLGCIVPAMVGLAVALLISFPKLIGGKVDSFLLVFLFAFVSGVYSVCDNIVPLFKHMSPESRAVLLLFVITLPLLVPLVIAIYQFTMEKWSAQVISEASSFASKSQFSEEVKIRMEEENGEDSDTAGMKVVDIGESVKEVVDVKVRNEHQLKELLTSVNFWLYFLVNASGSTLAMVYLNNLGSISESRGKHGGSFLLAMSSAFGFFGRLLCVILGWYTRSEHFPATLIS